MSPKLKKYVIFSLQSNILWLQFLFKKLRVRLRLHRRHYFFTLNFPCRDAQQRNRHPWNVSTNTKVITVTLSGNEIALEEQWSHLNKELILSVWTSRQCMKWALLTMTTAESCRVFFFVLTTVWKQEWSCVRKGGLSLSANTLFSTIVHSTSSSWITTSFFRIFMAYSSSVDFISANITCIWQRRHTQEVKKKS